MRIAPWLAAAVVLAAYAESDPWRESDLMPPEKLAARLRDAGSAKPPILFVGFPVLYRGSHIPGAVMAGPASKADGLELLKQAAAKLPREKELVVYCGCCPFDHCPNVRPAFAELRKMGFTNVRILAIPSNMDKDWVSKGYPAERGAP
jgi:thiosulfate/3-mercaptopyruvate sulfurtransferase